MNAPSNILLPMDLANPGLKAYPNMQKLVLSHSSLSMFRSCARKLEFRQFYGKPPTREDNYAGDAGNAIHRGFGTWLATEDETEAIISFGMAFPYDQEFLKQGQGTRSLEACYHSLQALIHSNMLRQYQVVKIHTAGKGEQFGIEIPFALHITGAPLPIPVYFVGFIDCVLYNAFKDQFLVTDLKTTRSWLDDPTAKFQFDQQTIPYGIVLEHILGRRIDEISVAYLYDYIDLVEPKIKLLEYKRTLEDILGWKQDLFEDIERIGRYYANVRFPRALNGDSCIAFNRPCWAHDICGYRDPTVLNRIIGGSVRTELFSNGEEPWIVAELPYEKLAA